jgi:GntR family transcriptional regulator, transcriptional repressor for pyruvate dehydrogenase complex
VLRRRILTGELDTGDEIAPEVELLAEFGVSRPSIRDAFRILETEGLIRIRRGRFGGATVMRPNAESAAYHLGLVLQSEGATVEDVAVVRGMLEPLCAVLCANHPERERIAETLEAIVERSVPVADADEDAREFTGEALQFHRAVVDECGNTTLRLLAGALESVWESQERRWADRARDAGRYPSRKDRLAVIEAHRTVIAHIAAGNAEKADRAMRAHVHSAQTYISPADTLVDVVGDGN